MLKVAVTPEWSAAVLAALSLMVSVFALRHSRRADRENLTLQAAITRIEEERHRQAQDEAQQATLSAQLVSSHDRNKYLVVTNTGRATALDVDLLSLTANSPRGQVQLIDSPFPVEQLHAGERITSHLIIGMYTQLRFQSTITWRDSRGTQIKKQILTLDVTDAS